MSATSDLRRMLDEAHIRYRYHGRYVTAIRMGDALWYAKDCYEGTLKVNLSGTPTPAEAFRAIVGPTATMTSTCDEDGVGHSECDACGGSVNRHDRFCRHCGARFVEATDG